MGEHSQDGESSIAASWQTLPSCHSPEHAHHLLATPWQPVTCVVFVHDTICSPQEHEPYLGEVVTPTGGHTWK